MPQWTFCPIMGKTKLSVLILDTLLFLYIQKRDCVLCLQNTEKMQCLTTVVSFDATVFQSPTYCFPCYCHSASGFIAGSLVEREGLVKKSHG